MSDERKPRGGWKEYDGEWILWASPNMYEIRERDGGFIAEEIDADGKANDTVVTEAPTATLKAAQLAVEDDVRDRAYANLRMIGLPPLGEVIEGMLEAGDSDGKLGNIEITRPFRREHGTARASLRIGRDSLFVADSDTADAAVRDVAAKLGIEKEIQTDG